MIELGIGLLIKGFLILYYIHRLAKETKLYGTALEAKKAKFIADGAEEWDIKNVVPKRRFQLPASLCVHKMWTTMVDESKEIVIDAKMRLDKALEYCAQ